MLLRPPELLISVVDNQQGAPVMAFRGRSYTMKGKPLVEGLPMGKIVKHKHKET